VNQKRAEMEELLKKSLKEDYLISYDEINKSQIGAKWLNAALEWSTEENGLDLHEGLDYAMKKLGFMKNSPDDFYKKRFDLNASNIEKLNNAQTTLLKYCEENDFQFGFGKSIIAKKRINCNGEYRTFAMHVSFIKKEDGDIEVEFTMQAIDPNLVYACFHGKTPEEVEHIAKEMIEIYGVEKIASMNYAKSRGFFKEESFKEETLKGPGM